MHWVFGLSLYFTIFSSFTERGTIMYLPPRRVVAGDKRKNLNISQRGFAIQSLANS